MLAAADFENSPKQKNTFLFRPAHGKVPTDHTSQS